MPPPTPTLLGHLRRLIAPSVSDASLLARWRERRDEAAFAALMARHGPMVLGVCRRVLGDAQHAEDAFQAVFLVLAQKAASVRRPEALPGFLYGVALRLARKARRRFVPSQSDLPEPVDPHPHPLDAITGRELLALLDEEIARLPEVFRLPLLLCVMQGRSVEEAARLLGWSHGSVRGRLARGRERLRQRLTRRGLNVSVGALALLAPVAVPERLLADTIRHLATPAPAVSALAAGSMPMLKLKTICLGLAVLAAVGLGAGLLFAPAPQPLAPAVLSAPASAQAREEPRRDRYGDPMPRGAIARLGSMRFRAPGQIETLAFAPDGKTLAVSAHGSLILMDAVSGRRIKHLLTAGPHWSPESLLAFAPDSNRLIGYGPRTDRSRSGGVVHVWELAGVGKPREYEVGQVAWLGWSADGEPLAVCLEKEALSLHEITAGRSRRFPCKDLPRFPSPLHCVCSPHGQTLAAQTGRTTVHVWDTTNGREHCSFRIGNDSILALALSSDGRTLASLGNETVKLWDALTGKALHAVATNEKYLDTIAFTPDGKTLATAGRSGVRFWDAETGKERSRTRGEGSDTAKIALSPDSRTLAVAERNSTAIHLWDVATGGQKPEPVSHRHPPYGATFSPDGRRVATCRSLDGTIYVWDIATGDSVFRIHRPALWVRDCTFSTDGRSLFSTWTDDSLWISDAVTGQRQDVLKLEDPERQDTQQSAWSMHLSDDGKTLVAFSYYQSKAKVGGPREQQTLITGWDASTHKQLFRRKRAGTDSRTVLSADARVLAVPYPHMDAKEIVRAEVSGLPIKQSIRLEDVATGEPLLTFPVPERPLSPLAFSPDGRLLALNYWEGKSGETTSFVPLWETATVAVVLTLRGTIHSKTAFSPDGRLLAVAAPGQEILVYDLAHGRERLHFKGFDAEVISLAFSPDGRQLISGLGDSTLLVWDVGAAETEPPAKHAADAVAKAWADLAGTDAPRAFRARGTLATTPEEAIPLLKEHMHPAKPADPQRLRRSLDDLASDQFAVREKAQAELEELGDLAEPALRQALTNKPTLEVRRRILAVLERLRGPVTRPEMLRSLRAVAVLEDIGTPAARRLLEELSRGTPEARVTREAKASLRRLERRMSAR